MSRVSLLRSGIGTEKQLAFNHKQIRDKVLEDNENEQLKDIAFFGRSNVGKSSLINSITGRNIALTSKTPGKTRHLTFIELGEGKRLVDCPGYGFAKVS